jgi:hypothetical protein
VTEINRPVLAWAFRDYLADRNGGTPPTPQELWDEFTLFNYYVGVNAPRNQFPPMEVS